MVSRTIEFRIANQLKGNEELVSMRPNLQRFEFFQEDLFDRRPDLRCQAIKMYYQNFNWVKSSDRVGLPEDAVIAGRDVDGSTIYAGRAFYGGHFIPAKVIPSKRIAYIPWNGHEHSIRDYEFLCGAHFEWVKSSNGHVPPGAVCSGKQVDGLALYVGRAIIGGSLAVGKVHTRYNCIYVPFDGREHRISHYEVLVERRRGLNWMKTDERYPLDAVPAGYDIDGSRIYVGRAYHNGHCIPAKVIPSKRVAYISWGGSEHIKRDYELLSGTAFQWVKSSDGHTPPSAVIAGREECVPLYIGRAHIGGSLSVGKIHDKYKCLYVPFNGIENTIRNYEILVELGSNFGGNKVYINNDMDFSTFLNLNINKVFVETQYNNVTSSSSFPWQPSPKTSYLRHNVSCTGCDNEIYDTRYKCMECRDVNLCTECEPKMHKQHMMVRITNPNDEPVVTEKAATTNQTDWTKIDEAEVKEARKLTQLDADFKTELMRLGLAELKILLNGPTESVPAQASQSSRQTSSQTQSPQKRFQSAPQSMSHSEPSAKTQLYPQLPPQPNVQSLHRTTYQPVTRSISDENTQTTTQSRSSSVLQPTAPPMPTQLAQLHPDERVNNGLKVMTAMGFSNEGGWLTQLLESVDGNIGKALDLMQNKK